MQPKQKKKKKKREGCKRQDCKESVLDLVKRDKGRLVPPALINYKVELIKKAGDDNCKLQL